MAEPSNKRRNVSYFVSLAAFAFIVLFATQLRNMGAGNNYILLLLSALAAVATILPINL